MKKHFAYLLLSMSVFGMSFARQYVVFVISFDSNTKYDFFVLEKTFKMEKP